MHVESSLHASIRPKTSQITVKVQVQLEKKSTKTFSGSNLLFYSSTITALFTNMRILKFKSQLTIAFFAAVNHLNGPLRKQNFTLTGSKGQGL